MTADVWYLSAQEVGVLLRRREVSALEVVQAMLERIGSLDSQFNAFITVTANEAYARHFFKRWRAALMAVEN